NALGKVEAVHAKSQPLVAHFAPNLLHTKLNLRMGGIAGEGLEINADGISSNFNMPPFGGHQILLPHPPHSDRAQAAAQRSDEISAVPVCLEAEPVELQQTAQ